MKYFIKLGIAFLCAFILTSCTYQSLWAPVPPPQNLLDESWLCQVNLDANKWLRGADSWFINGKPNQIEKMAAKGPLYDVSSFMKVRTGNFANINVNGDFLVQILGAQERNSVRVLGPNNAVRMIAFEVKNNTLFIRQVPSNDDGKCKPDIRKVIVQISICNLNNLYVQGNGYVFGRYVMSNNLNINSMNNGMIMLSGTMNLSKLKQTGNGKITVMGAITPSLDIEVIGNGCVNVSGRVGVRSIANKGKGEINIIGADTDCLNITASGCGKITVAGYSNLNKVVATDMSQVYVYWVNSKSTFVLAKNQAVVGLAGTSNNLNVTASDTARFNGQYLRANTVYVQTSGKTHANLAAQQRLFAKAIDESTIYYAGKPEVANYSSGLTMVLPLTSNASCSLPACAQSVCIPNQREKLSF